MIGERQELFFKNYKIDEKHYTFTFDLVCGDKKLVNVILDCSSALEDYVGEVLFEAGDKAFRLSIKNPNKSDYFLLYLATLDKLLHDYSHQRVELTNTTND